MDDKTIPCIVPSSLLVDTVVINRTGVVSMDSGDDIYVNSESIGRLVRDGVAELKPKTDYNGAFAAKVTVVVQLLGDRECRDVES